MTDVKGYCNSPNLLNLTGHKRELDYIKQLQCNVQFLNTSDVFTELYDTTSDNKDDIRMALESYEQQTKDVLFHAEISDNDLMDIGDGEVLKHFTDIAVKNKGRKDYLTEEEASECVLRLRNILEWCNDLNESFVEKWQAAYKYATNDHEVDFINIFPDEYAGLLAIFRNNKKALSKFCERIKPKKGAGIAHEARALNELGIIDDENLRKTLFDELTKIYGRDKIKGIKCWYKELNYSKKVDVENIKLQYKGAKI